MAKQSQIYLNQLAEQGFLKPKIREYLDLIRKHQPIRVFHEELNRYLDLDYEEGWIFIKEWAKNNDFSVDERHSFKFQLDALEADLMGREKLESEAASALNSLKAKAREDLPPVVKDALPTSLQKANEIQRAQIKDLESRLFDPMTTFYYNSLMLKDIGNADLRMKAATVLAAHPQIIAYYDPKQETAGRTHLSRATNQFQLILSRAIPELAPLYYTLRSDDMEAKTEKTLAGAKTELAKIYPGHSKDGINLNSLQDDIAQLSHLSRTGSTLTDISDIINGLPSSYLTQDIKGLDQTIRQIVVRAASGPHVSGSDLLTQLIRENKLPPQAALKLQFLTPSLELAEQSIRSELGGYDLLDRTNTREKWSANLAANLGINPSTFWLKDKELQAATDHFLKEYGVASLDDAITKELATATTLDRYKQLAILKDQSAQRQQYHRARGDNTLFYLQDQMNKFGYNLQVIKEPYDKASRRFWSTFDKIDDVIHYPQRKLADFWEDLVDGRKKILGLSSVIEFRTKTGHLIRIPLLNLPGFALDQFVVFRKYLATNVFKWSWGLSKHGGIYTPLKHVANYAFGFVQHDGDFRATNFYFGRKVMGNFLDWGAKQLKYESFVAMKTAFGKTAFHIGNKITGGLLAKAAAYLTSLGLSVEGIGIFLTAAMLAIDLTKLVVGFFKKLFKDENFRNKFLNWAPAIGIFIGGIGTFLAGIPAAIAFGFTGLISFIGVAIGGITTFFLQGALWAGSVVIGVVFLTKILTITTRLDPGPGLLQQAVGDIVCTLTGSEAPSGAANSKLAAGKCIYQLLSKFGINPLTESNAVGTAFNSFSTGLGNSAAAAEAARSATSYEVFQCVGFDVVVDIMTGGSGTGWGNANTLLSSPPSGYRPVLGVGSCSPGDFFVDTSGAVGHTGIFVSNAGPYIKCMDANGGGPGMVRDDGSCVWPTSKVAGCLKKN